MSQESKFWLRTGAILGGLAVVLGAFAAHGLEGRLLDLYSGKTREILGTEIPAAQKYLADFKTAAEYQMYHALAILAVAFAPTSFSQRNLQIAGWAFLLGIVLFSGSLYILVLTGQTKLGMITPIGGLLFIAGWVALLMASLKSDESAPTETLTES